jgi:hypothetical protein
MTFSLIRQGPDAVDANVFPRTNQGVLERQPLN